MDMNLSWHLNNDPESGLNPLLKLVNSNGDEENKAIISWANKKGIELINLNNCTAAELIEKRNEYRPLLERVLAGTNLEGTITAFVDLGHWQKTGFSVKYAKTSHMIITNLAPRKKPIGKP